MMKKRRVSINVAILVWSFSVVSIIFRELAVESPCCTNSVESVCGKDYASTKSWSRLEVVQLWVFIFYGQATGLSLIVYSGIA